MIPLIQQPSTHCVRSYRNQRPWPRKQQLSESFVLASSYTRLLDLDSVTFSSTYNGQASVHTLGHVHVTSRLILSSALLFYDYALTFSLEVKYIWGSKARLSTILYIFCRYALVANVLYLLAIANRLKQRVRLS